MIPKRLLIHNCTYSTASSKDRDGNAIYTDVELHNVRFTPVTMETAQASAGESKSDKLTLFIDAVNTSPAIIPEELARVTWQDKVYTIRSVTPCYTRGGDVVHHYEAALV